MTKLMDLLSADYQAKAALEQVLEHFDAARETGRLTVLTGFTDEPEYSAALKKAQDAIYELRTQATLLRDKRRNAAFNTEQDMLAALSAADKAAAPVSRLPYGGGNAPERAPRRDYAPALG